MITFITGVMKSGKSEELIKRIGMYDGRLMIIKPSVDTRDKGLVASRATDVTYPAIVVDENEPYAVMKVVKSLRRGDRLFIDEVQFFSKDAIEVLVTHCRMLGIDIVASGLMYDFKRDMFPSSAYLYIESDYLQVLRAECDTCEKTASDHVRIGANGKMVTTGDSVGVEGECTYKVVCPSCREGLSR
jgi:thymidine kinase